MIFQLAEVVAVALHAAASALLVPTGAPSSSAITTLSCWTMALTWPAVEVASAPASPDRRTAGFYAPQGL